MIKDKNIKTVVFLLGVFLILQSRLIDHPWNFTPIIAIGILCGHYFKNILYGYSMLVFSMLLGDLIIGFHSLIFFTYGALLFSVIIGKFLNELKVTGLILSSITASLAFFAVSNLGVWFLTDYYSTNLQGLIECYVAAIPFFKNTLVSTLLFIFVLKIIFEKLNIHSPVLKQQA
jgi:hypothetical protein|tara:strand:+ start:278 stop:799 length:522 start_codon:yes stop_codon:yes gene_type:complete